MKKIFLILIFIFFSTNVLSSNKQNIIQNLNNIENLTFEFEQNINGKLENGNCTIQGPKKILANII